MYYEDIPFSIRALYFLKNLVTVPNINYYYWVNAESTTRIMSNKKQIDKLAARKDVIDFTRKHNIILLEKYTVLNKTTYSFFKVPLVKVYEWETIKKYYLFGVVQFFEKRISL